MRLYFIKCPEGYGDGNDLDHFVWADDGNQAVKLWRAHYDEVNEFNIVVDAVFEISTTPPASPCVLGWADPIELIE